jgi:predicted transcriptional regulator
MTPLQLTAHIEQRVHALASSTAQDAQHYLDRLLEDAIAQAEREALSVELLRGHDAAYSGRVRPADEVIAKLRGGKV